MGTISDFIKHLPCKTAVFMITFYRAAISPLFPSCCRFTPTCSEYGIIAFRRYGFWKGLKLTVKRILRCRPEALTDTTPSLDREDRAASLVYRKEKATCGTHLKI